MSYSNNQLTVLARNNPEELARLLITQTSNSALLSFGIEALSEEPIEEFIILPVLQLLLKHVNAIVREGAIIGVSSFYANSKPPQDILDRLSFMSTSDPSPFIKEYSKSILEELESNE